MRRRTWISCLLTAIALSSLLLLTSSKHNSAEAGDEPPPYKTGISSPGAAVPKAELSQPPSC